MAIGLSITGSTAHLLARTGPKPIPLVGPVSFLCSPAYPGRVAFRSRRRAATICFVLEERKLGVSEPHESPSSSSEEEEEGGGGGGVVTEVSAERQIAAAQLAEKMARKKSERFTYLVAAVMSSLGITSMAVMAVYYRFYWQMEGGEVPVAEMLGTFSLSVGAAVGMEFWARWAHRALWHASLWHMHESHHKPREGPFELNDVFAIINAVPAIALLSYGFFNKGLFPGLCLVLDLESQYSVWRICLSMMDLSISASQWALLLTFPTSEGWLPPISYIIQINLMEYRMDCSWGQRSLRMLGAWRSWRKRSTVGSRHPRAQVDAKWGSHFANHCSKN